MVLWFVDDLRHSKVLSVLKYKIYNVQGVVGFTVFGLGELVLVVVKMLPQVHL